MKRVPVMSCVRAELVCERRRAYLLDCALDDRVDDEVGFGDFDVLLKME